MPSQPNMDANVSSHKHSEVSGSIPSQRWLFIIPVAVVMYMLAYLDRTNTSMILPYINSDPAGQIVLSKADEGLVSGIFFIGYMFLQIPAAILAQRWSAKKTVCILMILWGISAMLCGLVQSNAQFYGARFILGVFEGGVWPAVLVLLARWFPLKERARANALWMVCLPLSSVLIAPITGFLLTHFSWREVLIIEGIPPLIWAIVWMLVVSDAPDKAKWLSTQERDYIQAGIAQDEADKPPLADNSGYLAALKNPGIWSFIMIYFCWMAGFYGYTLWLPTVIKDLVKGSPETVGLLSAIPYIFAIAAMLLVSAWSDKTGNRRVAVSAPLFIGAVAMIAGQLVHSPVINMILLVVMACCIYAPYGPFWTIPAQNLRIEVLAAGLGLINALGNLGGFLGPYAVGWLTDQTGSASGGYILLAILLLCASVFTLVIVKKPPATVVSQK